MNVNSGLVWFLAFFSAFWLFCVVVEGTFTDTLFFVFTYMSFLSEIRQDSKR